VVSQNSIRLVIVEPARSQKPLFGEKRPSIFFGKFSSENRLAEITKKKLRASCVEAYSFEEYAQLPPEKQKPIACTVTISYQGAREWKKKAQVFAGSKYLEQAKKIFEGIRKTCQLGGADILGGAQQSSPRAEGKMEFLIKIGELPFDGLATSAAGISSGIWNMLCK
jgi:hypothetical protein